MARITSKHKGQQILTYSDFTGGLNTSNAEEMIAPNELSKAQNVEIDRGTGLLKTCCGTRTLLEDTEKSFVSMGYDSIGRQFILTDANYKVYSCKETEGTWALTELGMLTGHVFPAYAVWEDGILIASGGKMQYVHGDTITTLENSPEECNGVFVKDGRVFTYYGDELHASASGDEETWASQSDVDSEGQWLQIGYKDGGKIAGVTNLSSDILIFKDNGHAYHLYGQYPDWTLKEISRDIGCRGYRACCSIANEALVLSDTMLQSVSTTDTYGEMRADDVSQKIAKDIAALPKDTRLKYMPPLNQVWMLAGKQKMLFLDVPTGGYFLRRFAEPIEDAVAVGDKVYVLKEHEFQVLDEASVEDSGSLIQWEFRCKTQVSMNETLVKRVRFDVTPDTDVRYDCRLLVGRVSVDATMPRYASSVYGDKTVVYRSSREVYEPHAEPEYNNSEIVYDSREEVFGSDMPLLVVNMYRKDVRCCQRLRSVRLQCQGRGGRFLFNQLGYEYVEV